MPGRWRGGPRTAPRTTDANLDCAFVEKVLVFVALKFGRPLMSTPPLAVIIICFFKIDPSLIIALDVGIIVLGF